MATQSQAVAYLNGGWRTSPYVRNISAAGGYGIDVDGEFGFQCKDFANGLGRYLGIPLPSGNAIVLAQKLAAGWSWVTDPQPGDLAVRNYYATVNDLRTNFGDVLGITAVNGTTLTTIGQNQVSPSLTVGHVPTTGTHSKSEFIKFLRCNYVTVAQPQEDDMLDEDGAKDLYRGLLHREPENDQVWRPWVGKTYDEAYTAFCGSAEWLSQNDIIVNAHNLGASNFAELQAAILKQAVPPAPTTPATPTTPTPTVLAPGLYQVESSTETSSSDGSAAS